MFLLEWLLNAMVQHTDRRFCTFHKNHENYQKRQPCYDSMLHGACLLAKVYENWQLRFWEPCIWQLWRLRKRLSRCRSPAYKCSYSGTGKLQVILNSQFSARGWDYFGDTWCWMFLGFLGVFGIWPSLLGLGASHWEVLLAFPYPSRWYISISLSGAGGQTEC